MRKLLSFLASKEFDLGQLILYAAVGCLIGYTLASLTAVSGLLEDVYILAHEQKRLALAANQRAYAAASVPQHQAENAPDA